MSEFIATASSIVAKAEELSNLNGQLKAEITALETKVEELKSMWEGDAQMTFNSTFMRDKSRLDAYHAAIQAYIVTLGDVATNYQNSENKSISIAGGN